MNLNVLSALLKTEFAFDCDSYVNLRDMCCEVVRSTNSNLLKMTEAEIISFVSCAGEILEELYEKNARFDENLYNREIESQAYCNDKTRSKIYFQIFHKTIDEHFIMLFVTSLGLYANICDEDDDFWEMYGLGGTKLNLEKGLHSLFIDYCMRPFFDCEERHFDRKMAIMLYGLYSLAVSVMGEEKFCWHLKNFFHFTTKGTKDIDHSTIVFQHTNGDC